MDADMEPRIKRGYETIIDDDGGEHAPKRRRVSVFNVREYSDCELVVYSEDTEVAPLTVLGSRAILAQYSAYASFARVLSLPRYFERLFINKFCDSGQARVDVTVSGPPHAFVELVRLAHGEGWSTAVATLDDKLFMLQFAHTFFFDTLIDTIVAHLQQSIGSHSDCEHIITTCEPMWGMGTDIDRASRMAADALLDEYDWNLETSAASSPHQVIRVLMTVCGWDEDQKLLCILKWAEGAAATTETFWGLLRCLDLCSLSSFALQLYLPLRMRTHPLLKNRHDTVFEERCQYARNISILFPKHDARRDRLPEVVDQMPRIPASFWEHRSTRSDIPTKVLCVPASWAEVEPRLAPLVNHELLARQLSDEVAVPLRYTTLLISLGPGTRPGLFCRIDPRTDEQRVDPASAKYFPSDMIWSVHVEATIIMDDRQVWHDRISILDETLFVYGSGATTFLPLDTPLAEIADAIVDREVEQKTLCINIHTVQ